MSGWSPASTLRRLFDPGHGASNRLLPRWIFLRAIGLIYYSAFFSLTFQIRGLIGPRGILTAGEYLHVLPELLAHAVFCSSLSVLGISINSHVRTWLCS